MNPLPLALAAVLVAPTASLADTALTIYRSDGDALFSAGAGPVGAGHAVVHERRQVTLADGRQDLTIDGLPAMLDSEAVSIDFGGAARVLGQRVLLPGELGLLGAHRGERVVVSDGEQNELASGELIAIDGEGITLRGADGKIAYLRKFARIDFPDGGGLPGSSLQLALEVARAGNQVATLDYPTSGLGWRTAYAASIDERDQACRLHLDALASIANHSGRSYHGTALKLIAGTPNFQGSQGPAPRMMKAMAAPAPAPDALPAEAELGDYRSYLIDGLLDLPDASVTQVPLHASQDLDCTRRWLVVHSSSWFPAKPNWQPANDGTTTSPVSSQLLFTSAANLPAGRVRVLTRDRDGHSELLAQTNIGDTPRGRMVTLEIGTAFALRSERERTAFSVDRAARTMDEAFRVTLTNGGDSARTLTVREHPNRWRAWELAGSSAKASRKTPDLIEFAVAVPANGKAVLEYRLRYTWHAGDE